MYEPLSELRICLFLLKNNHNQFITLKLDIVSHEYQARQFNLAINNKTASLIDVLRVRAARLNTA